MKLITICLILTAFCGWVIRPTQSQVDGDVRLAGFGSNPSRGKLEIFYNGTWGRVCSRPTSLLKSRIFELDAANVVCRQLGLGFAVSYSSVLHEPKQRLRYGQGSGLIHLDDVNCFQTKHAHLLRCRHGNLGAPSPECTHEHDVSVECSDVLVPYKGEVRLSNRSSGLLELYSNDQWAAICHEDSFGQPQADTVCKQLGYTGATNYGALAPTMYNGMCWDLEGHSLRSTTTPCFSDSVPIEPVRLISGCSPVYVQCVYSQDDTVNQVSTSPNLCTLNLTTPREGDVRITTQTDTGPVEVFQEGMWSPICYSQENSWDIGDVVCKQLRYPTALLINPYSPPIDTVYNVECNAVETNIKDCIVTLGNSSQCSSSIMVTCGSYSHPYGEISLKGGAGPVGNVFLFDGNEFKPICSEGFEMPEAHVACKQLGYERAISVKYGSHSETTNNSELFQLPNKCSGSEDHLFRCTLPPANSIHCNNSEEQVVAIQCATSPSHQPALRLVDGAISPLTNRPSSGRLEVSFDGIWGTIGDTEFDQLDAHVACIQLGFATASQVFDNSRFGNGTGPMIMNKMQCRGGEEWLLDCPYDLTVGSEQNGSIGLQCSDELPHPKGSLRLSNGSMEPLSSHGRLEVFKYGVWMSVCGHSFTMETAHEACVELGHEEAASYCINSCFGEGGEYSSSFSNDEDPSLAQCSSTNTVGLVCRSEPTTQPPVPTTMPTGSTPPPPHTPTLTTIIPGLSDIYFYIIVSSCVVLVVLVGVLVCCLCCIAKRRRNKQGTWRSPAHTNGVSNVTHTTNGHPRYLGNDLKHAMEKVADFDDPLNPAEMNGFTNTPSTTSSTDSNLDYKPEMSGQGHSDPLYENLPRKTKTVTAVSNMLYVEEMSPASPPPGYDELDFLPQTST